MATTPWGAIQKALQANSDGTVDPDGNLADFIVKCASVAGTTITYPTGGSTTYKGENLVAEFYNLLRLAAVGGTSVEAGVTVTSLLTNKASTADSPQTAGGLGYEAITTAEITSLTNALAPSRGTTVLSQTNLDSINTAAGTTLSETYPDGTDPSGSY